MIDLSGRPPDDGGTFSKAPPVPDDDSDATPTAEGNSRVKDRQSVEQTIRFRFVPSSTASTVVSPRIIHAHWIQSVQDEFGDHVHILDNYNRVVPKVDILRWTDLQHQQHFQVHQLHSKNKAPDQYDRHSQKARYHSPSDGRAQFIIHRIRTNIPLKDIKAVPRIFKLLTDNACYVNHHKWPEDIWDTTQIGFMANLDPQFYTPDQATSKVSQKLKQAMPKAKIPPFRLVFSKPQYRHEGFYTSTKAYSIETEKSNGPALTDIMKQAFRDSLDFVPFKMRNKNPQAFVNRIQQQSSEIANNYTIILQNIGTQAMFYLSDHIYSIDGVLDIMPSKTVDTNGNFRVLVKKSDFRSVRKVLTRHIPEWFETHVESDAIPIDGAFPGSPRVAPIVDDGYSSSEDSYMNLSINTALSYDGSTISDSDSYSRGEAATSRAPGLSNRHPRDVQSTQSFNWAARLSTSLVMPRPPTGPATSSLQPAQSPPHSDVISELASSRAETEELRNHLNDIKTTFENEKQEMLKNFAIEKQTLIQAMKDEMAKSIKEQMQQYMPLTTQVEPPSSALQLDIVQAQIKELFEIQDKRYAALTDMVASIMISNNSTSATAKRPSDQVAHSSYESPHNPPTEKKQNVLSTPRKHLNFTDGNGASASPSLHTGHQEAMDLSDDRSPQGDEQADSSRVDDSAYKHHKHD